MDALQQIIHSLTPPEKRYFKLFAMTFRTNSDLLLVYDELEKEKEVDDKKLSKQLGIKNIAMAKSNLRALLLKAMRNFREEHNIGDRIRSSLSEIEFLTNKNLKAEARKEIKKLTKLVNDSENHYATAELAMRDVLNMEPIKDRAEMFAYVDGKQEQIDNAAKGMVEMYEAMLFHTLSSRYMNAYDYENPSLRKSYSDSFLNKALQRMETAVTLRARLVYTEVAAAHLNTNGEFKKAGILYEKNMKTFKDNPSLLETSKTLFFSSISNYLVFSLDTNQPTLTAQLLNKLETWASNSKTFFANNPDVLMRYRLRVLSTKTWLCKKLNQPVQMLELEQDLEELLSTTGKETQPTLPAIITLRFTGVLVQNNLFEKGHYWLEKYFALPSAKKVKVMYHIARLLEVMLFFNLGQFDLADSKAVNFYKTINDTDIKEEFYQLLGKFLRKLCKWNFKQKKDAAECNKLIAEMETLLTQKKDSTADLFFEIYDLRLWWKEQQK
ncbi:MAG: hypothetical protein NTY88_05625 [Bacteroidetes bacterium]|nr:hypothetical protein [Bacteroidota bacterium]